jgi:PAS domain S-box-containing protein
MKKSIENFSETAHPLIRILNRVVGTMTVILCVYVSIFSWQTWRDEKLDRITNLQNIMELGERAIDTYFVQLENRMIGLSRDMVGTDGRIDLDHGFDLVKRFKESHPELLNISFMREDGQVLFTSVIPPGSALPTLAQKPSFIRFREEIAQGRSFNVSQPLVSLTIDEWVIPIRYVIRDKNGNLAYIIGAGLPIGLLQNYWKDAPFTKTAALGLIRDDGYLVSRYPVPDRMEMDKIYGSPRTGTLISYLRRMNFSENGYVEGPSGLDGPDCLHAFHRLKHFPITLFITLPMSDIYRGWWDYVKIPYLLTAVLVIGGFFIYRLMIRRECAMEKERWLAGEAVRKSEERLKLALEASQEAVWDKDLSAGQCYFSPRWWKITGHEENDLGVDCDPLSQLLNIEDFTRIGNGVDSTGSGLDTFEMESRFRHKNGHDVPVQIRGLRQRDGQGKVVRISGTCTDLTEKKRIEAERRQWEDQRRQLQKAESLNRMAYVISYHYNKMIANVINRLEFVLNNLPLGSDNSEKLIDAMKSSHKAADVGRQLSTYLGRTSGKPEMLDFSDICHKGLLKLTALIPENIQVDPTLPFPGPVVLSNMNQMHQVLENLVTNACEAIDHNPGMVAITVNTVASVDIPMTHRFPVDWQLNDSFYGCLEVTDTGNGISEANIEQIFDPFFTTKSADRGLGLSVVLGIVGAHGGGITVDSSINYGSVFRVFLPMTVQSSSIPSTG